MQERLREQIRYETELVKALLLIAAALTGGSLGIFFGSVTVARSVLAAIGIAWAVLIVIFVAFLDRRIRRLIRQLQEEDS